MVLLNDSRSNVGGAVQVECMSCAHFPLYRCTKREREKLFGQLVQRSLYLPFFHKGCCCDQGAAFFSGSHCLSSSQIWDESRDKSRGPWLLRPICARSVCWPSDEVFAGRSSSWSAGIRGGRVSFLCKTSSRTLNLKRKTNATFTLQIRAVSATPTLSEDIPSSPTSTSESALILIRHGESLWNQKNLFTGCVDVPLSREGVEEAIEAGKRISTLPVDIIFTSALIRAQMTAMLAMTQHRMKKVPVILHNESSRAKSWSSICSSKTRDETIPVFTAWELNERMYGELQGLNKKETAEKFGIQKVQEWRRSYDIPPPNGESLAMCAERAVNYFSKEIEPLLSGGKNVLVAAHGNSLRSIIMYLDSLTPQEVIELELSTGVPMLYVFKDGKFLRRGSPISPDSTGPYAFTPDLALYRERLDKMLEQEAKAMEEIAKLEN